MITREASINPQELSFQDAYSTLMTQYQLFNNNLSSEEVFLSSHEQYQSVMLLSSLLFQVVAQQTPVSGHISKKELKAFEKFLVEYSKHVEQLPIRAELTFMMQVAKSLRADRTVFLDVSKMMRYLAGGNNGDFARYLKRTDFGNTKEISGVLLLKAFSQLDSVQGIHVALVRRTLIELKLYDSSDWAVHFGVLSSWVQMAAKLEDKDLQNNMLINSDNEITSLDLNFLCGFKSKRFLSHRIRNIRAKSTIRQSQLWAFAQLLCNDVDLPADIASQFVERELGRRYSNDEVMMLVNTINEQANDVLGLEEEKALAQFMPELVAEEAAGEEVAAEEAAGEETAGEEAAGEEAEVVNGAATTTGTEELAEEVAAQDDQQSVASNQDTVMDQEQEELVVQQDQAAGAQAAVTVDDVVDDQAVELDITSEDAAAQEGADVIVAEDELDAPEEEVSVGSVEDPQDTDGVESGDEWSESDGSSVSSVASDASTDAGGKLDGQADEVVETDEVVEDDDKHSEVDSLADSKSTASGVSVSPQSAFAPSQANEDDDHDGAAEAKGLSGQEEEELVFKSKKRALAAFEDIQDEVLEGRATLGNFSAMVNVLSYLLEECHYEPHSFMVDYQLLVVMLNLLDKDMLNKDELVEGAAESKEEASVLIEAKDDSELTLLPADLKWAVGEVFEKLVLGGILPREGSEMSMSDNYKVLALFMEQDMSTLTNDRLLAFVQLVCRLDYSIRGLEDASAFTAMIDCLMLQAVEMGSESVIYNLLVDPEKIVEFATFTSTTLDATASLLAQNSKGQTALMIALEGALQEVKGKEQDVDLSVALERVKFIFGQMEESVSSEQGSAFELEDHNGRLALDYAMELGDRDLILNIINQTKLDNILDRSFVSAMIAGEFDLAADLFQNGADFADADRRTIIDASRASENEEEAGEAISLLNEFSKTKAARDSALSTLGFTSRSQASSTAEEVAVDSDDEECEDSAATVLAAS